MKIERKSECIYIRMHDENREDEWEKVQKGERTLSLTLSLSLSNRSLPRYMYMQGLDFLL
jgi:hypothetical protein